MSDLKWLEDYNNGRSGVFTASGWENSVGFDIYQAEQQRAKTIRESNSIISRPSRSSFGTQPTSSSTFFDFLSTPTKPTGGILLGTNSADDGEFLGSLLTWGFIFFVVFGLLGSVESNSTESKKSPVPTRLTTENTNHNSQPSIPVGMCRMSDGRLSSDRLLCTLLSSNDKNVKFLSGSSLLTEESISHLDLIVGPVSYTHLTLPTKA